jgi:tetratricopeptide (TPR) repeat protein
LRANHLGENPATLVRARDLYLEALADDATYAPAWARLARTYRFMAKFEVDAPDSLRLAEESAGRALALNPELSLAHFVHAQLELESGRVRAAISRLLDRVRLHRRDPHLFAALVQACRYGGLLDPSIAADQRARELEPVSRTSVAYSHWMAGDLHRALDEARRAEDMGLGLLLVATGKLEEARAWLAAAAHRYADFNVSLEYIRSLAAFVEGDRDASVAAAESVYRRSGFSDCEGLYYVAMVMMWNGDHDRALAALSRAASQGFACLPGLDLESAWQPLRTRSAFGKLRDQVERRHLEIKADFERSGGAVLFDSGG